MKKWLVILIMIFMFSVLVNAESEHNIKIHSSNIEDRQIGVDQNIIIELVFKGENEFQDAKNQINYDYELYENDEKGNLSRVNIAINANKKRINEIFNAVVKIKPDSPLKPLASYVLIIKDTNKLADNNELIINFRTKDNSKMQYTYVLIGAICLAALYIFKIKK